MVGQVVHSESFTILRTIYIALGYIFIRTGYNYCTCVSYGANKVPVGNAKIKAMNSRDSFNKRANFMERNIDCAVCGIRELIIFHLVCN